MFRRSLAALVIVAVGAALLVAAWPQLFGLQRAPVVAQVVSLRGFAIAVAILMVIALTLAALLVGTVRRFAAGLAVTLLVFCGVSLTVLATRGFGSPGFESATDNDVTVLGWNTLGDAPGAGVIAQLALDTGAEIVALPETTRQTGLDVAAIMGEAGKPMWVYTVAYDEISKARSTTLLVSIDLGEYVVDESERTTAVLPTIIATPQDGTGPTIIAVHAVAPIPGEMDNWRADLDLLARACEGDNVIMVGDFNSTLDHYTGLPARDGATLGNCVDAALATDNAAVGTWPTMLPALVGSPIDHVMATSNWRVSGMRVIESHDTYGTDHRPVLAQLTPAG